jgi:NAD(P)H-dependent FMN reductase
MKVVLVFGSTREERLCKAVAMWAAEQIWNQGRYALDIIDPAALPLPILQQRENDTEVTALRRRLGNADAFVVVTPGYDHGYPAALQSLIDAADVEWQAKPVAFVAYGGASGGLHAVEQLRLAFAERHAVTVRDTVSCAGLRKALLIFHAPLDAVVEIDNASELFMHAKYPKSFVFAKSAGYMVITPSANSAYKEPYVSDAIRRAGIKPGERRQNEAALLAS